ncbi:MAG TPA: glycoside hydrolase family 3 protein [Streptosporangiaceae bacterium]|nr:glycoside hydrolase family 3 protein [Streptosporangiaceae bacterium]
MTVVATVVGCAANAGPGPATSAAANHAAANHAAHAAATAGSGTRSTPPHQAPVYTAQTVAQAKAIVARMSVQQKVGQLLVPTIPGLGADQGGAALVRDYHLGGVIYFQSNVRTARQVAALSHGLQHAALTQRPAIPLLIGTDQEGGIVSRLAAVTTQFPGQMAGGATRDPALVQAQERATGTQLRTMGLNLDYSPVADVNTNPANPVIGIRSFGSRPGLVSAMTSAAVAGFHQAGVAAVAKHFPGHGDTNVDSHTGLPVIHHTLRQWWHIDAPPFQAAIRAGVDEIMIAHIVVPALDNSGQPASLSYKIVTGTLRDKLGYQGVVTTDSLLMAGVLKGHTPAEVAVQAIQAGCDQLLMPGSVPVAYQALLAAVRDGRISTPRLDASVTRIITLKVAKGLLADPSGPPRPAANNENTPPQRNLAAQLGLRSVTVARNNPPASSGTGQPRPVLPFSRGERVYVAGPSAAGLGGSLATDLAATGGQLVSSPAAADVIVVATLNAVGETAQQQLAQGLQATGTPVVVVATGEPYDLGLFPAAAGAVATYSVSSASMAGAAAVLTGRQRASGQLPVSIPGSSARAALRYGTGLRS